MLIATERKKHYLLLISRQGVSHPAICRTCPLENNGDIAMDMHNQNLKSKRTDLELAKLNHFFNLGINTSSCACKQDFVIAFNIYVWLFVVSRVYAEDMK